MRGPDRIDILCLRPGEPRDLSPRWRSDTIRIALAYRIKELSRATWPDFVRLFSGGNGWDFCWCMHFHRPRGAPGGLRTRAERAVGNRADKERLVAQGRTHGVLVYDRDEPVAWCQYGPAEELPRIDGGPKYRAAPPPPRRARLWRVTCFVVDKRRRRKGLARLALEGALDAIARAGGGVVEGYPIAVWRAGTMDDMQTHGPVEIFRAAGFREVAPYGDFNLLMRKVVRKRRSRVRGCRDWAPV